MRLIATALTLFVFGVGVLNAENFWCSVKKVDGNKVTLNRSTKKEKLDNVTLTTTENCKVTKAHWNKEKKKWEAGDPIEGGLKSNVLTKLAGEGVRQCDHHEGQPDQGNPGSRKCRGVLVLGQES